MRLVFSISILAMTVFPISGPAAAGVKETWCYQYSLTAVAQNRRNFQSHCGFTGNRWSDNSSGHARWCMSLPNGGMNPYIYAAGAEQGAREKQLRQCNAGPGGQIVKPGTAPPTPPKPATKCPSGWKLEADGICYQKLN